MPLVASFPANLAMLARGGAVVETADGVCAGVVPMSGGAATALGMGASMQMGAEGYEPR